MSDTLAYLATPYSKYPRGLHQAFIDAAKIAGKLISAGMNVYSPIAHMHQIAIYSGLDPLDHRIWLPLDGVMMSHCDTVIVAHMEGWRESKGIAHEIEFFKRVGKPIFDLPDVTTCTLVRRPDVCPPRADHQRESWEANVGDAY